MKKILWLALVTMLFACQQEELDVVENQEDTQNTTTDLQLMSLVQSVTSHDGSYDDVVDRASCFSINLPYVCLYNGYEYVVDDPSDLKFFDENDELIPVFPITVTFADHLQREIDSYESLMALSDECAAGTLFNQQITCIDFDYPLSLSIFNTENSDFETLTFNHDRDVFTGIESLELDEGVIATLNYPLTVRLLNGNQLIIESNDQLRVEILNIIPLCD